MHHLESNYSSHFSKNTLLQTNTRLPALENNLEALGLTWIPLTLCGSSTQRQLLIEKIDETQ